MTFLEYVGAFSLIILFIRIVWWILDFFCNRKFVVEYDDGTCRTLRPINKPLKDSLKGPVYDYE